MNAHATDAGQSYPSPYRVNTPQENANCEILRVTDAAGCW